MKGMEKYGYYNEAYDTARKILDHMLETYNKYEPHTIWECYSPTTCTPATTTKGSGVVRPDFCGWSALGPISIYIEFVLGFHTVNAFTRTVEWEKPTEFSGEIGIRNLRFGDVVTDIVASGNVCHVTANAPYLLKINGKTYRIPTGESSFSL